MQGFCKRTSMLFGRAKTELHFANLLYAKALASTCLCHEPVCTYLHQKPPSGTDTSTLLTQPNIIINVNLSLKIVLYQG